MRFMLFLGVLEGEEERLRLFDGEVIRSHPSYEDSLLGDMTCALADMPSNHLKLSLIRARR